MVLAASKYAPLEARSLDAYLLPILIVIPAAVMIGLEVSDQMERFAILAGLMFVLAGAVLPSRAAFYYLNGALDKSLPVEVQAVVSSGSVGDSPSYVLNVSVPWNQRQIKEGVVVSRDIYSFAETGDSLRLAIYSGAFKQPWYRPVVISDGSLGRR